MLMLTIQVIYHSSFEVPLLRAHPGGVSGSLGTLILVLREKGGIKFSFGSRDLTCYLSNKSLGDFLGCLPIFLDLSHLSLV